MKRWLLILLALVASFSLVFVACGGDDDDDSSDNDEQSQDEGTDGEDEGDGDDSSDEDEDSDEGDGGAAFSGDEEEYVSDVCGALNDYIEGIFTLVATPENSEASEEEQLEIFEPIFADLVSALEDADPPGDIEEYHGQMVATFEESLEKFRAGDVTVFDDDPTESLEDPPDDVQAKYNEIAQGVEECEDTGFFEE